MLNISLEKVTAQIESSQCIDQHKVQHMFSVSFYLINTRQSRAFRLAKSSIILQTSIFCTSAFSIDKTDSPLNLLLCSMLVATKMRFNQPQFWKWSLCSIHRPWLAAWGTEGKKYTNCGRLAGKNSSWQSENVLNPLVNIFRKQMLLQLSK